MNIRPDLIATINEAHYRQRIADSAMLVMENLRDQLDPQMKGWMPTGGSGDTMPLNVASDPSLLREEAKRAFYQEPYGKVVIRNMVKFIIGSGTIINWEEKEEEKLKTILAWWKMSTKSIKWFSFQREYVTRFFRDGEVFVRKFATKDGPLKLRFIDPELIADNSIITDPADVQTVLNYKIRVSGQEPITVPASEIHHLKNADANMKRGRPLLEAILPYIAKYKKWLEARMVLNIVRASVAIVQQVQGTSTDLLRLASKQKANDRGKDSDRTKMLQPGTIIRGTPGTEYKMLSPNLDAKDASEDGRTIQLAMAAGAGFPDTFVTGDYCHSMDTEVLTETGWKLYGQLSKEDAIATWNPTSGNLEYQKPESLRSFLYKGTVYSYEGKRMGFNVTAKHQFLVSPYHEKHRNKESLRYNVRPPGDFTKIPVEDLSKALYCIPGHVNWENGEDRPLYYLPNGESVDMEDWLKLLGYVVTDGCVTESTRSAVQIAQKTESKIPIIQDCLNSLPWKYTTTWSNDCAIFRIWNREVKDHIVSLIGTNGDCYSQNKHLPDFIWNLSPYYLNILLEALVLGDGARSVEKSNIHLTVLTSSPRLANDVQRLAVIAGYMSRLSSHPMLGYETDENRLMYGVHMSTGRPQLLETRRINKLETEQQVWCATVPNGTMVTRYKGRAFISSNSKSNFASSVVAQNPAIREFEDGQKLIAEGIVEIIDWILSDGMEKGEIDDRANLDYEVGFPPLLKRDLAQETAAYKIMYNNNVISRATWQIKAGLNPDGEDRKIEDDEFPQTDKSTKVPQPKTEQPPKRVDDRNPRQTTVGNEKKKQIRLKLLPKDTKEKDITDGALRNYEVEYEIIQPEREADLPGGRAA